MLTKIALRIELSDDTVRAYDDQNEITRPVEELMAQRLVDCIDHNAERGLYFNDAQRAELEKIFGYLLPSANETVQLARNMATVKIAGVNIRLEQAILKRAKTRADAMRMSLEEWLEKEIAFGLETAVGLRG